MSIPDVNHPEFWENIYQSEVPPGWELGQPAPPFVSLLMGDSPPPPGRIAILGCGTGNEVALFATHGFEVVGVDFAPSAGSGRPQKSSAGAYWEVPFPIAGLSTFSQNTPRPESTNFGLPVMPCGP